MAKNYIIDKNKKIAFNTQKTVLLEMLEDIEKAINAGKAKLKTLGLGKDYDVKYYDGILTKAIEEIDAFRLVLDEVSAAVEDGSVSGETEGKLGSFNLILRNALEYPFVYEIFFREHLPELTQQMIEYTVESSGKNVLTAIGSLDRIIVQ